MLARNVSEMLSVLQPLIWSKLTGALRNAACTGLCFWTMHGSGTPCTHANKAMHKQWLQSDPASSAPAALSSYSVTLTCLHAYSHAAGDLGIISVLSLHGVCVCVCVGCVHATGDLVDEWEYMQASVLNAALPKRKARRTSLDMSAALALSNQNSLAPTVLSNTMNHGE